jgi:hypothetical protein
LKGTASAFTFLVRHRRFTCTVILSVVTLLFVSSDVIAEQNDPLPPGSMDHILVAAFGGLALLIIVIFLWVISRFFLGFVSNRAVLARGFSVDGEGMVIPKAGPNLRSIPRQDIHSVRVVTDASGVGICITASKGAITLPTSLHEEISAAGYSISDPDGLLMYGLSPASQDLLESESVHHGKRGRLLVEETPLLVAKEVSSNKSMAALFLIGSFVGIIIWVVMMPVISVCSGFCIIALTGPICLGTISLLKYRSGTPIQIYENGIAFMNQAGWSVFVPWSQFDSCEERTLWGDTHFWIKGPAWMAISIKPEFPEYEWLKGFVSERVGNPRYDVDEYHLYRLRILSLAQVLLAGASLVGGIAVSIYVSSDPLMTAQDPFIELVYVTALSALGIFTMIMLILMRKRAYYMPRRRFSVVFSTVFITVLLLVYLSLFVAIGPGFWAMSPEAQRSDPPTATALEPGEYVDDVLWANSSISVRNGETLSLVNCRLKMGPTLNGPSGIWIATMDTGSRSTVRPR